MTSVGNTNAATVPTTSAASPAKTPAEVLEQGKPLKVEQNRVTLSEEGKALLHALQQIDKEAKETPTKVESFTHGALGLDHPDAIEEKEDTSYSAGQYVKGALSVGAILLALV